jgi:zinc transport system permease protein
MFDISAPRTTMLEIFQYGFILRGLEAGIIVALVAPLIGIFLVLRRYSLIADTLAHVSLAGIALGLLSGINPILAALAVTAAASLGIERLREAKRVFGESALALFLSGSLAFAIVVISLSHGFNTNLLNYLFGSILTVTEKDVWTIALIAALVCLVVIALYKELLFTTFDEEAARVAGLPVRAINTIFIVLAAIVVSLSIPVVGVLLISALIVIPVLAALQWRLSFVQTLLLAEAFSVLSVIIGIMLSFYYDLAAGGTIVLITLGCFLVSLVLTKTRA